MGVFLGIVSLDLVLLVRNNGSPYRKAGKRPKSATNVMKDIPSTAVAIFFSMVITIQRITVVS